MWGCGKDTGEPRANLSLSSATWNCLLGDHGRVTEPPSPAFVFVK